MPWQASVISERNMVFASKIEHKSSARGREQIGREPEDHPCVAPSVSYKGDRIFEGTSGPLPVEVVSEGPHCVPCEYAIAAVEYVAERYEHRIRVKVLETKSRADAIRYLELCACHGGKLPIPAILFDGRLVFDDIPGPDELCEALDKALRIWESDP